LYSGQGLPKDEQKAIQLWRKAAERGHGMAFNNLGFCHYTGTGLPKDFAKAVQFWRQGAASANVESQASLGEAYALGRGVAQDEIEAYAWYTLGRAALANDPDGREIVRKLELKLTATQRAQAMKRADALRATTGTSPAEAP
jgi:hypothetical protein